MDQSSRFCGRDRVFRWVSCVVTAAFLFALLAQWLRRSYLVAIINSTWWVIVKSVSESFWPIRSVIFDGEFFAAQFLMAAATMAWLTWPLLGKPSARMAAIASLLVWSPIVLIYTGYARMSLETATFLIPFTSYWITVILIFAIRMVVENKLVPFLEGDSRRWSGTTFSALVGSCMGVVLVAILLASMPFAVVATYLFLWRWWTIPAISGLWLLTGMYMSGEEGGKSTHCLPYLRVGILLFIVILVVLSAFGLRRMFP